MCKCADKDAFGFPSTSLLISLLIEWEIPGLHVLLTKLSAQINKFVSVSTCRRDGARKSLSVFDK